MFSVVAAETDGDVVDVEIEKLDSLSPLEDSTDVLVPGGLGYELVVSLFVVPVPVSAGRSPMKNV